MIESIVDKLNTANEHTSTKPKKDKDKDKKEI